MFYRPFPVNILPILHLNFALYPQSFLPQDMLKTKISIVSEMIAVILLKTL